MGLFKLFGSNESKISTSTSSNNKINELDKIIKDSNKVIKECQKADGEYNKDGDIKKRISVYEQYCLQKPQWNCFNFCYALAEMYIKAGENDKAWGYLNMLYSWTTDANCVIYGYDSKVRHSQFKLLKAEKRFKEAMVMLVSSYVLNAYGAQGTYFNKGKFIKEAKTTAKGLGFSEEELKGLADKLEFEIMNKKISEKKVRTFCERYYSDLH